MQTASHWSGLISIALIADVLTMTAPQTPALAQPVPAAAQPEGAIVLGLDTKDMRVEIAKVEISGGLVTRRIDGFLGHSYGPTPDGYVVVKTHGDGQYVIGSYIMQFGPVPVMRFSACRNLVSFSVPAGKVLYVTTVEGLSNTSVSGIATGRGVNVGASPTYRQDFDGARTFLRAHYPSLADRLEQGKVETVQWLRGSACPY